MDLSFLADVKLTTVKPEQAVKASKLPTDKHIRVYANGDVYPSLGAIEMFEFNFSPIVEDVNPLTEEVTKTVPGLGLSIFRAHDWVQYPKDMPNILLCALMPKVGAADLWGSGRYTEEGTSTRDVTKSGKTTFGAKLKEYLTEMFHVDWTAVKYFDFDIGNDYAPLVSENEQYYLPKFFQRGPKSGRLTYNIFHNAQVFPVIAEALEIGSMESTPEARVETDLEYAARVAKSVEPTDFGAIPTPEAESSMTEADLLEEISAETEAIEADTDMEIPEASLDTNHLAELAKDVPADVAVEIEAIELEEAQFDAGEEMVSRAEGSMSALDEEPELAVAECKIDLTDLL